MAPKLACLAASFDATSFSQEFFRHGDRSPMVGSAASVADDWNSKQHCLCSHALAHF